MARKKKGNRLRSDKGPVFQKIGFDFEDKEDWENFRDHVKEVAEARVSELPQKLNQLDELCSSYFPLQIFSIISLYGHSMDTSNPGLEFNSYIDGIHQHHLELLQAFLLTCAPKDFGTSPAVPPAVQQVVDLSKEISACYFASRLATAPDSSDQLRSIQERMRLHTQAVRNWGYFPEVVRTLKSLYSPADREIENRLGFTATQIVDLFTLISNDFYQQSQEHFNELRSVFRQKNARRMVKEYYRQNPEFVGSVDDFLAAFEGAGGDDALRSAIMAHAELRIFDRLEIDIERAGRCLGVDPSTVGKILSYFSLECGNLERNELPKFFLANPAWLKPVLKFGSRFYNFLPMSFFSHAHYIFKNLFSDCGLDSEFSTLRSDYLESEVERLLRSHFPDAEVRTGWKWNWEGRQFETDALVLLDKAIFIIECKSHHLTESALRGADRRLKQHVKDLVVDPSKQSERLFNIIEAAIAGGQSSMEFCAAAGIEIDESCFCTRLSVSLEDLSVLIGCETPLREVGWLGDDQNIAPYISLLDLEYVLDILDSQIISMHYFREREFLFENVEMIADEMDVLGFYIETGFNVEFADHHNVAEISLTGMSMPIDRYYMFREVGTKNRKPNVRVTPFFRRLLRILNDRKGPGWIRFGVDLLSAGDFREQQEIIKQLKRQAKLVRKGKGDLSIPFSAQVRPPRSYRNLLLFALSRGRDIVNVRNAVPHLAAQGLQETGRTGVSAFLLVCDKDVFEPMGFYYLGALDPPPKSN